MNRYSKYAQPLRSIREALEANEYGIYINEVETLIATLNKDKREAAVARDFNAYNEASELLHKYTGE